MKRIFCLVLLCILVSSQFQIGTIYANSVTELSAEKQKNIQKLEVIEQVIDTAIGKIDDKTNNSEIESRLKTKEQEVEEYLNDVKQEIQKESNKTDIKKKVKEAQKVVVLKVVSGATQYEDSGENISADVANTPTEIREAKETLQESLETESGDYSLIVRTKYDQKKTLKLFHTFDTKIVLEPLYDVDGENYFEVTIPQESIFRQEMMEDIEKGILPETYLGIHIVQPEVFGIQTLPDGEDIATTWGIQQYQTYEYFADIESLDSSIQVGVVDTGIDYRHPDLSANVSGGYDFVNDDADALDDQGHGTHVAGTIAAGINGQGIIGVNPYATLVPLKICNAQGFCPSYAVIRALDYAIEEKIDILNMSLGGRANPRGHAICSAISAYSESGGIVVSAAGNSNIDTLQFVPGGCDGVISVAATDESGHRAVFSNYGNAVDVAAPGVGVYSTYPVDKGNYRQLSGTSMAAPHITGLVSILKMYDTDVTTSTAQELLKNFPKSISTDGNKPIAAGVDVSAMMDSQGENVAILEEKFPEKQESIESEIIPEVIPPTPAVPTEKKDTHTDDNQEWVLQNPFSPATSPIIDFGDVAEILETNTDSSGIQSIDVEEILEDTKQGVQVRSLRVYDENGNAIEDPVEINNQEELIPLVPNTKTFTSGLSDMPEQESTEPVEVKEIFLDGAEGITQINSLEDGEEMIIEEDETLPELGEQESYEVEDFNYTHDKEIFLETPQISSAESFLPVDENGYIIGPKLSDISHSVDTQDDGEIPQEIELEISDVQIPDTELLIDGAEKPIQINSLTQEVPTEIKVEAYQETNIPEIIEGEYIVPQGEEDVELSEQDVVPEHTFDEVFTPVFGGEIPIPEGFIDEEDTIGEDEEIPGVIDEEVIITDEPSFGIQNTFSCETKIGQPCYFSIYKPYRYSITVDTPGITNHRSSKRYIQIIGAAPGTVKYEFSQYGRLYYTIYVTVKVDTPVYDPIDVTVQKGKYTNVNISQTTSSRFVQAPGTGAAIMYQGGRLRGNTVGTSTYYVFDHNGTTLLYKININIIPVPPTVIDIEMYQGKQYRQQVLYAHDGRFQYNLSNNNIRVNRNGYNAVLIHGDTVGDSTIIGSYKGEHTYTINVSVLPVPVPKEYSVTVEQGKTVNVYFPNHGNNKTYSIAPGNTGWGLLYNYSNSVGINGRNIGNLSFYVKDNSGFTHYIIHTKIIPKLPETRKISLYQGQTSTTYINNAKNYSYSTTNSGVVGFSYTSSRIMITGKKVGTTKIVLSQSGHQKYIVEVQVKTPPKPQVVDVQVQELQNSHIYLSKGQYIHATLEKQGNADIEYRYTQSTGAISMKGLVEGKIQMTIRDSTNLIKYILNITVIPTPPTPEKKSIFQTRSQKIYRLQNQDTYSLSRSDKVSVYRNGYDLYIKGQSAGEVQLYVRDWRGRHYKTFSITVLTVPEPTVYPVELYNGQGLSVYLPDAISNYRVTYSGTENMLQEARQYTSHFYVRSQKSGQYNIHLKDINGFDTYRIEITSAPHQAELTLIQTEYKDPGLSSNDRHVVNHPGIASIIYADNIQGKSPGVTQVQTYDDHIHIQTTTVTVLPIPEPIEIDCTMYKNEQCRLDYYHGGRGIQFTTDTPEHISVEYGKSTTRIKATASGTATVKIKAHNADYIKYIMNITVLPDPVQHFTCTFPQDLECQTKWYDNQGEYTMTTNNPHIVDLRLERYTQTFATGTRTMERTKITGKTPGTAQVYLYHNTDHKATIHVIVTPPIPPITVADGSVTLKQGESIEIPILNGGGNYRIEEFDSNIITFDVDNHSTNLGDIDITGKEPGKTYPIFTDQYGQSYQMSIRVTDTTLDLTHQTLKLSGTNPEYITATNFHTDVTFTKSNNNIRITKEIQNDDQIAFLVTPLEQGTTDIVFTDNEENMKVVEVVVGDGNNNGDENSEEDEQTGNPQTGIRYIRDWSNGSNKSTTNSWVEIKVFEKGTGKNLAKGIIPTTDIVNPTGSLKNITDEKIIAGYSTGLWTGKSYANTLNYIQIDLGDIYEVDSVGVWRFFTDGRTFNKTKTEVSSDGITWTSLFDSALEGTYVEPKDGSGRIYEVDGDLEDVILGKIDNEIDTILKGLSLEINGVQEDNERKRLAELISPEKLFQFDQKIDVISNHSGLTDTKLANIITRLKNGVDSEKSKKKVLYEYVYISFIIIQLERQESKTFTQQEKRTLKDTLSVYYEANLLLLDDVASEILDKIIELNDKIPYDEYIKIGEKLELIGVSGIIIGGTICEAGTIYATTYAVTSEGAVVIPGIIATGSCAVGGGVAVGGAGLGGAGLMMQGGGRLGKASQTSGGKNLQSQNQIKRLIEKGSKNVPKSVHRLDKDVIVNGENIDPAHIHIIRDSGELAVYKGGKFKHEKGNISLNSKETEFLRSVGWIK